MSGTTAPFDSEAARAFRAELRAWLARELPAGWGTPDYREPADEQAEVAFLRAWQRRLFEGGWAGLSWPAEYGGRGASLVEQAIFVEERDRAKAPIDIGIVGTQMVGPMLIAHGSAGQRERYLRRILRGDDLWCQGFSEPSAGSDLAALRTKAEPTADGWRLNGQKVWTSRAQHADLMILLARTDAAASSPHRGITAFVVPMTTPGLEIRPLRQINGSADFCEVFLTDVLLPREAVIGAVDEGWSVAVSTLSFERLATTRAFEMRRLLTDLLHADPGALSGPTGDTVLRLVCEAHAAGLSYQRMVAAVAGRDGAVGVDASAGKLFTSELGRRIAALAMSVLPEPAVSEPVRPWRGGAVSWPLEFVNSLKNTIAAGTSQIQRNIIGERVLGLPREGRSA